VLACLATQLAQGSTCWVLAFLATQLHQGNALWTLAILPLSFRRSCLLGVGKSCHPVFTGITCWVLACLATQLAQGSACWVLAFLATQPEVHCLLSLACVANLFTSHCCGQHCSQNLQLILLQHCSRSCSHCCRRVCIQRLGNDANHHVPAQLQFSLSYWL
jgi:hypothetical protein